MEKEIMEYIFNGTSFNLQKGDPAICNSMEESWWHYAKRNEEDQNAKYTSSHLYMEPKKSNTLKKSRTVVTTWWESGQMQRCSVGWISLNSNVQQDYTE